MIPTLLGAGLLVFTLLRLIPGDVCVLRMVGGAGYVDPKAIERIRSAQDTAQTRTAWRNSDSKVAVVLDWVGAPQDTAIVPDSRPFVSIT